MSKRVVIAAGGTGGHLFPAQSLAQELSGSCELLFVAKGIKDNPRFNASLYNFVDIASAPVIMSPKGLYTAFTEITRGILQSRRALKAFKPDVVVGFGSFHTFPVLAAARMLGIPIVLHEANRIPGKVNRLFSRKASFTGIFFPDTDKYLKGKAIKSDIPLRPAFRDQLRPSKEMGRSFYGLREGLTTVLVFGGSLGAKRLNELAAKSLCLLGTDEVGINRKVQVLHFTGSFNASLEVRNHYAEAQIPAVVRDFESEMQYAWAAADLCLSRSGASTIAEQVSFGVPALFIPYPYATDQHQEKNAEFMVDTIGGAHALLEKDLEPKDLAQAIDRLLCSDCLEAMRGALQSAKGEMQGRKFSDLLLSFLDDSVAEKKR